MTYCLSEGKTINAVLGGTLICSMYTERGKTIRKEVFLICIGSRRVEILGPKMSR